MPSRTQKPCDQCHRRKVRCSYDEPCNRCKQSDLACSYSIIRKKRGPRKGKGSVLNHLRNNTATTDDAAQDGLPTPTGMHHGSHDFTADGQFPLAVVPSDMDFLSFDDFAHNVLTDTNWLPFMSTATDQDPQTQFINTSFIPSGPPTGDTGITPQQIGLATSLGLIGPQDTFENSPIIQRCVQLWFEHQYPTYPLLDQATVLSWLQETHLISTAEQTVIWSMCALALVVISDWPDIELEQREIAARQLIRACQRVRPDSCWGDFQGVPEFEDVLASLFIAVTYFELKCRKASWVFVRRAITLACAAGLHEDEVYQTLGEEDRIRRRRAYALLYITERGAAMFDGFPVSLLTPPPMPDELLAGEDPSIPAGLRALHDLFSLLDFKFVKVWNGSAEGTTGEDLVLLQAHLRDLLINDSSLSDIQRADVLITQQWLRLVFFNVSLRLGLVSTQADDPAFTYDYPAAIAMSLCNVVKSLPPVAIQVHGLGIFEKQFDVAYSLMDTLALSGTVQPEHHECLRYLLLSLSASPSSRQIYVRTLERKMGSQHKYRNLAGVELLRDIGGGSRQVSRRQSLAPGPARKSNIAP